MPHKPRSSEGPKAKLVWKKPTFDLLPMTNKVSHGKGEMGRGTEAEMSGYGNEDDKCDGDGSNRGKAGRKVKNKV